MIPSVGFGNYEDVATLEPRLVEILEAIVDTYDAPPPEQRRRLMHLRAGGGQEFFNEWGPDRPRATRDDLDELHDLGLIDLDISAKGTYQVKPSREGREGIRGLRRDRAAAERHEPVDLSWGAVRPVLHVTVDLWTEAGAPRSGWIQLDLVGQRLNCADGDLAPVAEQLAADGWLEVSYDEEERLSVQPTSRAVAATRGWPAGDPEAVVERLLAALDELVETASPEEREKADSVRQTLGRFASSTIAELGAKLATSGVGGG